LRLLETEDGGRKREVAKKALGDWFCQLPGNRKLFEMGSEKIQLNATLGTIRGDKK